ncbi:MULTISPECIES: hypothetical protein, partial [Mesorhizobium]|uniref:hypothetical protein n=1 Tax=unclassified Mesorhizobium TaxID=325217 RepID=UPI0015967488
CVEALKGSEHRSSRPRAKGATRTALTVKCAERLIEQEERRISDQGSSKRHALLLAAAQLRRHAAAKVGEVHAREHAVDLRCLSAAFMPRISSGNSRFGAP